MFDLRVDFYKSNLKHMLNLYEKIDVFLYFLMSILHLYSFSFKDRFRLQLSYIHHNNNNPLNLYEL